MTRQRSPRFEGDGKRPGAAPSCTVVIVRPELVPAFCACVEADPSVLVLPPDDLARALATIRERGCDFVALEAPVAELPFGRALIAEIRQDARLAETDVRVLASADLDLHTLAGKGAGHSARAALAALSHPASAGPVRRAPRYSIVGGVRTVVNGGAAALVDLSVLGAQIVSPMALRPNERVNLRLADEAKAEMRARAVVAWSTFEMSRHTRQPQYRVGLEFTATEAERIEAYCAECRRRDRREEP